MPPFVDLKKVLFSVVVNLSDLAVRHGSFWIWLCKYCPNYRPNIIRAYIILTIYYILLTHFRRATLGTLNSATLDVILLWTTYL